MGEPHKKLIERFAPASVLTSADGAIVHLSAGANRYLRLGGGELSFKLIDAALPALRADLQIVLLEAGQTGRVSGERVAPIGADGEKKFVRLTARRVESNGDGARGDLYLVVFDDAAADGAYSPNKKAKSDGTREIVSRLQKELAEAEKRWREKAVLYEVGNEELESVNEELRVTIQDFEQSQRELRIANEKLQTANERVIERNERLTRADSVLHNLINSMDIATIFLDRDFKIKQFTPRTGDFFNLRETDIGRPLEHLTNQLDYAGLMTDAGDVLRTLQPIEREVRAAAANQIFIARFLPYHTVDNRVDGVVLTFIDITGRKQAEEALHETAESLARQSRIFDTTLSSITDYVYVFDCAGRFVYANQSPLDLLGFTLEKIIGKNFYDLNYPEDLAVKLHREIQLVFDTGATVKDETPFVNASGTDGFYEYIFSPVTAADGSIESVVGTTRDVTTRKRLESNLKFSAEISLDLTKMSGIDEIMRNVGAKIGAYLDLSNCALIEVNETEDAAVVNHGWHRPDAPELRGLYRFSEYLSVEFQKAGRAGENFIINDTQTDSRADAAAYARIKIGSFLGVPVIEDGEWRFMLIVYKDAAHVWQADEIELMNDLTKRIWVRLELARSDKALRESETRYRTLFSSIDEGFYLAEVVWDEAGKAVDIRYLDENPAAVRMVGQTAKNRLLSELDPNYEPYWRDTFGRTARTGEAQRLENYAKSVDMWFDFYVFKPEGVTDERTIAIVFQDITERKRSEEKLREAGEFNSAVLSSLTAQIAVLNADGDITAVNEAWRRFARENGNEHTLARTGVGVNYLEVCRRADGDSAADARRAIAGIQSVLQGELAHFSLEYPCHSPVEKRWFLLNTTPLRGGRDGAVVSHLNITERWRAEEALQKSRDELEKRVEERTVELSAANTDLGEANVNLAAEVVQRKHGEQERGRLLHRVISAQEDECRRIARDMHDQFGQQLTALNLKLALLKAECGDRTELGRQIEALAEIGRSLDRDVDFLVWELRPTALDDLGLVSALTNFARNWSKHFHVPLKILTSGFDNKLRLAPDVETSLYRITQEALNNISKYAAAENVSVFLNNFADHVSLVVEDDGKGFDVGNAFGADDKALGLVGMRERAALVGGTLEIESEIGAGTSVIVRISTPPVF